LGLILDTSIIITGERRGHSVPQILAQVRDTWGETEIGLSAVTIAELTHGIQRARLDAQRQRQQAFVDEVMVIVKVHAVTAAVAQWAGAISGQAVERGLTLPFEDLLIGATALHLGFEVATHNVRHFEKIPGLVVRRA
jgi:tRNA(fMet)-specific endonuclease VapC